MSTEWYCKIDGLELGPMSSQAVKQLATDGKLKTTDSVRKGADGNWVDARRVVGLSFPSPTLTSGTVDPQASNPRPQSPTAMPVAMGPQPLGSKPPPIPNGLTPVVVDARSEPFKPKRTSVPPRMLRAAAPPLRGSPRRMQRPVLWLIAGLAVGTGIAVCAVSFVVVAVYLVRRQEPRETAQLPPVDVTQDSVSASPVPTTRESQEPTTTIEQSIPDKPSIAQLTKRAWDQKNQIDVQIRAACISDLAKVWQQNVVLYAQIDTDYIDPELRQFINDWIRFSSDAEDLIRSYTGKRQQLSQAAQNAAQFGAAIGSTNQQDPRGGAMAGALVFGMLGQAAENTQVEELKKQYTPSFQALDARHNALMACQKELAEKLSAKYGLPFYQKFR